MEIGSVTDDWDWESLDICGCFKKDTDEASEKIDIEEHVLVQPTLTKSPLLTNVQVLRAHTMTDSKVMRVALGDVLAAWEVEAGAKFEWGGQDGLTFKGDACFKASDDNGNYTELEIEQESNGTGSLSVTGGHKEAD